MNPLTNIRNITKLNEQELKFGVFSAEKSWHSQYKDSAYIFIGGLPYELTEGDILCVFSQYGEIININLVRDKKSGKSKGYGFIAYEDQRSTVLAVDNFNGIKLGGRTIRVDHVQDYRRPTGDEKDESGKYKEIEELGCAPQTPSESEGESEDSKREKKKKSKKERKEKKAKKAKKKDKRNEYDHERNETSKRCKTEIPGDEYGSISMDPDITKKGKKIGKDEKGREQLDRRSYKENTRYQDHRSREGEGSRQRDRDYRSESSRQRDRGYKNERNRQRDGDYRNENSELDRDRMSSKHKDTYHKSSREKYERPRHRSRSRSPAKRR